MIRRALGRGLMSEDKLSRGVRFCVHLSERLVINLHVLAHLSGSEAAIDEVQPGTTHPRRRPPPHPRHLAHCAQHIRHLPRLLRPRPCHDQRQRYALCANPWHVGSDAQSFFHSLYFLSPPFRRAQRCVFSVYRPDCAWQTKTKVSMIP